MELRIIQKIPELPIGKAINQGAIENSHIEHYTHSSRNTEIKVPNIYHGKYH
jgi:hypothetical protein